MSGVQDETTSKQGTSADGAPAVVRPLLALSRTFPRDHPSIAAIRAFVEQELSESLHKAIRIGDVQQQADPVSASSTANLDGTFLQILIRVLPHTVEVNVLREPMDPTDLPNYSDSRANSFATWMAALLKRERLSQEAASRTLGVSVRTVSRWVTGQTRPRHRELQRIREVFGEIPFV